MNCLCQVFHTLCTKLGTGINTSIHTQIPIRSICHQNHKKLEVQLKHEVTEIFLVCSGDTLLNQMAPIQTDGRSLHAVFKDMDIDQAFA